MARENYVRLRGILPENPIVSKLSEGSYANIRINVVRQERDLGNHVNFLEQDEVRLIVRNESIIQEVMNWHAYDIVDVKGFLSTKSINKTSFCPNCGARNKSLGSIFYIVPNFVEKLGTVEGADTSDLNEKLKNQDFSKTLKDNTLHYLSQKREISNVLKLFGTVISSPEMIITSRGLAITRFQLAVNRKFLIKEDDPNIKTDYPWVQSYGDLANVLKYRLKKGSEIYIDGCIQTRAVERYSYCNQARDSSGKYLKDSLGNPIVQVDEDGEPMGCGQKYSWIDIVGEITPYSVEFLDNVLTEEEAFERRDIEQRQSLKDSSNPLFGTSDMYNEN